MVGSLCPGAVTEIPEWELASVALSPLDAGCLQAGRARQAGSWRRLLVGDCPSGLPLVLYCAEVI